MPDSLPRPSVTGPAPGTPAVLMLSVCECCLDHGDLPLENRVATCTTCGAPCSCQGCIAEANSDAS